MKRIKKGLLLALSFAMSMTLFAACGGDGDNSGNSSLDSSEQNSSSVDSSETIDDSSQENDSSSEIIENSSEIIENSSEVIENSSEIGGDDPEIGEVVVPKCEQVDADGWASAIAATRAATNFTVVANTESYAKDSSMTDPTMTSVATISVADNKAYEERTTTTAGVGSVANLSYCGNVDGKFYVWDSYDDGASWSYVQMGDAMDINGTWMWEGMFSPDMTFETATYNADEGIYTYTAGWDLIYSIGFAGGKVAYFSDSYSRLEDVSDINSVRNVINTYVITYGNATIGELPPLENNDGPAGGNEMVGEQLADEAAWVQAWNTSISSTNATATFTYMGEDRQGALFEKGEASGTFKVADGKFHGLMTESGSWNLGDGDVGDEEWIEEWYIGAIDGVWYAWDKDVETGEWLEDDPNSEDMTAENYTTVYGILYEFELPFESYYTAYEDFTYTDGAYVLTVTQGSYTETVTLKFVDGKLAWYEMVASSSNDGYASNEKMQVTFTYGNTTIGELPPLENDDDSESGGEIENPDAEVSLPEKFTVQVELTDVVTQGEWEEAVRASAAATNFKVYSVLSSRSSTSWQSFADGKASHYVENVDGSVMYSYFGAVDGSFYTWISVDGESWSCQPAAEFPISNAMFFTVDMVNLLAYENAVYDEQKGLYTVTGTFMEDDTIIEVIVNDGKIVSINGVENLSGLYQFSYGDAYVGELPPVMENDNSDGAGNSGTTTDKNDNVTDDNGGMTDNNDNNGNAGNENGTVTDEGGFEQPDNVIAEKETIQS